MKIKIRKLMDFIVDGKGFQIYYNLRGIRNYKEDKYWIYFKQGKQKKLLMRMREDECILLSALLNFSVHKKLVEIDKIGCN